MNKFATVFKFTFDGLVKDKAYRVITALIMVAIIVIVSWPRITQSMSGDDGQGYDGDVVVVEGETVEIAVVSDTDDADFYNTVAAASGYPNFRFTHEDMTESEAVAAVGNGLYDEVMLFSSPLVYKRVTNNVPLNDEIGYSFRAYVENLYRFKKLQELGASSEQASDILGANAYAEIVLTENGKNQGERYWNVYMVIFLLYFATMLYGQIIASSVATEKSSRAMEVLITSADTKDLMFGKVFGTSAAALLQLVVILLTMLGAFKLNAGYHAADGIMAILFNMPTSLIVYAIVFFLLGFLLYAFIYAACASFVSKLEELSPAVLPATLLFIASFMIVMFAMPTDNMSSTLLVVCSYVPFTSPLCMYARIALSAVPSWEIALSLGVLVLSTIGLGYFVSLIYRVGVLMYGVPIRLGVIKKQIKAMGGLR